MLEFALISFDKSGFPVALVQLIRHDKSLNDLQIKASQLLSIYSTIQNEDWIKENYYKYRIILSTAYSTRKCDEIRLTDMVIIFDILF